MKPGDLECVVCESDGVRIALLPELGAKVISLYDRRAGREWLAPPAQPYRRAHVGDCYDDYDRSGWDECFPSIASAPGLADHGELWAQPWRVEVSDGAVLGSVDGVRLPYRFERRLLLQDDRVVARYSVENTGDFGFRCLWAQHPLVAAGRGLRIVLPADEVTLVEESGERVRCDWPLASMRGRHEDLSRFGCRDGFAAKLFTPQLQLGRAALLDDVSAETWLGTAFDPVDCPYLGLWLNDGGWPSGVPLRHLALEPTSGCDDELAVAERLGDTWLLEPGSPREWTVELVVGRGRAALRAFLGDAGRRLL